MAGWWQDDSIILYFIILRELKIYAILEYIHQLWHHEIYLSGGE